MRVTIDKGQAIGEITAPPSKSMAHRLLICAALSEGTSVIHGVSDCDDVQATMDCLRALHVSCTRDGDTVTVQGIRMQSACTQTPLFCRESGSTIRFLIPICLLSGHNIMLTGSGSLLRRPLSVYEALSKDKNFTFQQDESSVIVRGPLQAGNYRVTGNVSSQFISGLLFALPLAGGNSTIDIIPPVESRSYIELTCSALRQFGVTVNWTDEHTIMIPGNQQYRPVQTTVEGDYSGAAFFAALQVLGGDIQINGLKEDSIQGDKAYIRYFKMLNKGTPTIHIGDCPDLGPVLFAVAAAKYGGIFTGTARLKLKESDRGKAMAEELKKFGTSVTVYDDTIVVYPLDFHAPAVDLCGHGDHRIVMALSVLLTLTGGSITGAEAVAKSFPGFFGDLEQLGIKEIIEQE